MKGVLRAGAALLLAAGCVTTPRTRQVTDIYRDTGESLRLTASVEQESAQQFRYSLAASSLFFFWHPLLWHGKEWNIRHKEALVYRRVGGEEVVREEREVLVRAENSGFLWGNTPDMIRRQDEIYRYVLTRIDRARRKPGEAADVAVLCEGIEEVCAETGIRGDGLGEAWERALADADGAALAGKLARLPYTVAPAELPIASGGSATVTVTHVQPTGAGGYRTTTTTVTVGGGGMPLVNPFSTFNVRVFRCFTDAKSGRELGTTDDVYVLKTEVIFGDGVCQTLMN